MLATSEFLVPTPRVIASLEELLVGCEVSLFCWCGTSEEMESGLSLLETEGTLCGKNIVGVLFEFCSSGGRRCVRFKDGVGGRVLV